ncbi:MAG: phosphotransferase family protein [Thalassobaculales bacterium]
MGLNREGLAGWFAQALGGPVSLDEPARLGGGAIQENWLVALDGPRGREAFVLRTSAPSRVAVSLDRLQEYRVLCAAHAAGVTVPEPLGCCADAAVIGKPFYVMRKVEGVALGPRVVKEAGLGGDRVALARRLAGELALVHRIDPAAAGLDFLGPPPADAALAAIAAYRQALDALGLARPALEWGLRWCERHPPPGGRTAFCHRDFRTGNYMVDGAGLTAILDWEFAGWSDPVEDLAWFCVRFWRFSAPELEAGGIAPRAAFLDAYAAAGGRPPDPAALHWWEIMGNIRWGVIALQQCFRHLSGEEPSLELALIGRRTAEMELEVLRLMETAP